MADDLKTYEQGVIGATLLRWQEMKTIGLSKRDFSDPNCEESWEAFVKAEGKEDYYALLAAAKQTVFVSSCMDNPVAASPGLLEFAVGYIKKAAEKRRLWKGVCEIWQGDGDVLSEVSALVEQETQNRQRKDLDNIPLRLYESVITEVTKDDTADRIYTGIKPLDVITGGLRRGNVSILGAEPSTGKTAFALNIVTNAIKSKKKVLFFSLEMSSEQLMERLISAAATIDYTHIGNRDLDIGELSRFKEVAKRLTGGGLLYIIDTTYSVEQMAECVMELKPDLVVVDFLQFCRTREQKNNTADKIEYIVSEFKRLAKLPYCSCHIMLLSQPSRSALTEKQSMFAMKGSSAIEQGGDVIFLLDRPAVRDSTFAQEQANVKVGKNKFGRTGNVDLYFEGRFQRFRERRKTETFGKKEEQEDKPW